MAESSSVNRQKIVSEPMDNPVQSKMAEWMNVKVTIVDFVRARNQANGKEYSVPPIYTGINSFPVTRSIFGCLWMTCLLVLMQNCDNKVYFLKTKLYTLCPGRTVAALGDITRLSLSPLTHPVGSLDHD